MSILHVRHPGISKFASELAKSALNSPDLPGYVSANSKARRVEYDLKTISNVIGQDLYRVFLHLMTPEVGTQ